MCEEGIKDNAGIISRQELKDYAVENLNDTNENYEEVDKKTTTKVECHIVKPVKNN